MNYKSPELKLYTSKKKSFLLLIGSLLFVVWGIYAIITADELPYRNSPLFTKTIGLLSVSFFSLGIYASIKQLFSKQLVLVVGKNGVNVNPSKSSTDYIEWKNLRFFTELKIARQKFIIVNVDNPEYWIEKEKNKVRKRLMKFNLKNYGSPFNLSANLTQLSHSELMKVLNEKFEEYRGEM